MAAFQKSVGVETWVSCPTCSREILVTSKTRLPEEFSVPCPNCGRRNVYQPLERHGPKPHAEATEISGKISFSAGKKETTRRKSWLSELTSLLVD